MRAQRRKILLSTFLLASVINGISLSAFAAKAQLPPAQAVRLVRFGSSPAIDGMLDEENSWMPLRRDKVGLKETRARSSALTRR